jgi:hypothetical protein
MEATPMRSLPDHVRGIPSVRPPSIARAAGPYLGLSAAGFDSHRIEDAALQILAAAYAHRGPVRESLLAERLSFDRLVAALNRCPIGRGGD